YLPKKARAYVPSAAGLGLGFVVAGFDSISMFIGSLIAWYLERRHKRFADNFTLATASGIMAGASLMGIILIVLSQVVPLLATP
ncbi:MAG: OPT/YSL family transporter, partial [Polyangiaceae bacterium]